MEIPKKGDIVINPQTLRPIRVAGRVWLSLVKQGIINGHYQDSNKLAPIGPNPQRQIAELNKTLPRGQQAVRGRGKYKGHLTLRNKQPDTKEISRYTARIAGRILGVEDSEDLERRILREMSLGGKGRRVGKKSVRFVEEEEEEEGEEEKEGGGDWSDSLSWGEEEEEGDWEE